MLRYSFKGEVHKDFHGLTCATIHYLLDNYGSEAVSEILKNTAQKVYRTMYEELKKGSATELLEYWEYYFSRENGDFDIEKTDDEIKLIVKDCPALRHLTKLGQQPDPIMCEATAIFNNALTEDTPFILNTEKTGTFSCIQTLKKREIQNAAE